MTARLIIIDDETDLFPLFKIKFKQEIKDNKIKLDFFTSGEEAIKFLESNPGEVFKVVLSDLNLPTMGGLDILKKLKSFNIEQKIFLVSAQNDELTVDNALKEGADGFFGKPVDFARLKKILEL